MAKIIFENNKEEISWGPINKPPISTGFLTEREVYKKRSKNYIHLINSLDHKALSDTKGMNDLLKKIQEEFGTTELTNLPLGIVSKCFLGHPYEVHTIDLSRTEIIKHYKISEVMPQDFEKARVLAKHNAYALIEVYKDKLILIREDGTPIKL